MNETTERRNKRNYTQISLLLMKQFQNTIPDFRRPTAHNIIVEVVVFVH